MSEPDPGFAVKGPQGAALLGARKSRVLRNGDILMSRRTIVFPLATAALLALAGCNGAAPPPQPVAAAPAPGSRAVTPPDFKLPEGAGCTGAIARYRAIQENDLSMGHVNKSVYDKIQTEIADAEKACAAGDDAKAQALIRASKARHGYPA